MGIVAALLREQGRESVCLHVVDVDQRLAEDGRERLGSCQTDAEAAGHARALRHGDSIEIRGLDAGFVERSCDGGREVGMMTQRGGEGVNPGEGRVILLCDDGRQDGAVGSYDTSTRVIAGRLDAQDEPRFGGAAEGAKGSVFASKTREVVDPTNSPRAYRSYGPHAALTCPVQLVPSGSSGRKRRCV